VLDRLGRSVRDVCNIAHELEQLGVRLIVADQGGSMDTGTPAGRLLFHVLAAVGEMERSLCVERVRSGLAAARARGQRLGRPRLAAEVVERARALRDEGTSWRVSARTLGVSVNALRRALWAAA
jgi:Enterobacteriaceae phage serine recombinase